MGLLFNLEFLKWLLLTLNLDVSTVANRVPITNQKQNGKQCRSTLFAKVHCMF